MLRKKLLINVLRSNITDIKGYELNYCKKTLMIEQFQEMVMVIDHQNHQL